MDALILNCLSVDLIEKSVLLCYEIIEFEPSPPAVVIQFDDIRRVSKEEFSLVKARVRLLNACELEFDKDAQREGLPALRDWWDVHRYVFSGEKGTEFSLEWIHPALSAPLQERGLI